MSDIKPSIVPVPTTQEAEDEVWQQIFGLENTTQPIKYNTTNNENNEPSNDKSLTGQTNLVFKNKKKNIQKRTKSSKYHYSHKKHSSTSNYNTNELEVDIQKRLSEFLCTLKYRSRLPEIPIDCKFLQYPHAPTQHTKYCSSNLELNYEWQMHSNTILPLTLDLMDPEHYQPLNVNTEQITEHETIDQQILQLLYNRKLHQNTSDHQQSSGYISYEEQAFLLQTQYLTSNTENMFELKQKHRRLQKNDRSIMMADEKSMDIIQKSFIDINDDIIEHPRNSMKVKSVWEVYPTTLIENCTLVSFDKNPMSYVKKMDIVRDMNEVKYASEHSLLRSVNRSQVEKERRREAGLLTLSDESGVESMDELNDGSKISKTIAEHDWFTLYADVHGEYQWCAEFIKTNMDEKQRIFLMKSEEDSECLYGELYRRIKFRQRNTESMSGAVKNVSSCMSMEERKFCRKQPNTIHVLR